VESEPAATSPPALARVVPLASVLLFLLMSATQAGKPLHLDNMDFPAAAEAVARTGRPVYYRGEDIPEMWALYHPPLYVHVLAGWFLVFGSGAAQARLFGAVCAVLFCWLAVKLSRMLLGPEARAAWGLWPVFLLQAYTLQGTGILDIDTTVYGPLLLALAGAAVWIGRRRTDPSVAWWEVAVLGVLVALALWAKLTTVWLVVAGLPLLLWPRFRPWRSGLIAAAALAAGTALFLVTYLGYCALVGGDAGFTFGFLVHSFQRGRTVPPYAANLAFMGPFVARWSGLLPWVTAPLVFTPWFPRWFSLSPASRLQVRALVGMALLGSVYYMGQVMTFGYAPFKYIFVFWPLVLLPLGWMVGRAGLAVSGRGDRALAAGIVGALATAGIAAAVRLQDAHLLPLATTGPGARAILALPALVALVAAAWSVRRVGRTGAILWLAAAALQIGFQGGLALRQARAEHSTDYDYGQLGLADAVGYVRAHTREDEAISSMKDVAFQARRRFFENYLALYGGPAEVAKLIAAWEDGSVSLIVFTEENGQDRVRIKPALAEWLLAHAELVASPGNYRIYRPLPRAAAPAQEPPPGAAH
jgi:hypothetical protein